MACFGRCEFCLDRVDALVDGLCIDCFFPDWPAWAAELLFEIESWRVTSPTWMERLGIVAP